MPSQQHTNIQTDLFTSWVSAKDAMPKNGQKIVIFFESEGEIVGPISLTAFYVNGKYFYKKILWWMPIPSLPKEYISNFKKQEKINANK